MQAFRLGLVGLFFILRAGPASADVATLWVESITLSAGQRGEVVVWADTGGNPTFGVELLVQIVRRPDSTGLVVFTPSPPIDITQAGDPWPGAGKFTKFDTDAFIFSSTLNGAVDDDGRFVCGEVMDYSGPLVSFPVIVGPGADGVWDVRLSTDFGDSIWTCVPTTLVAGTITVSTVVPTVSTWGLIVLTGLLLGAGSLLIKKRRAPLDGVK